MTLTDNTLRPHLLDVGHRMLAPPALPTNVKYAGVDRLIVARSDVGGQHQEFAHVWQFQV
jgi:hypothetical protein